MTRTAFINEIEYWYELKEFCNDEGCDYLDEISSGYDIREDVNEFLVEYARDYNWRELRDSLDNVPEDDAYYRVNGFGDYDELDDYDDFDTTKSRILEWADEEEVFDPEEDEEEVFETEPEECEKNEEDNEPIMIIDDGDFDDYIGMATIVLGSARKEVTERNVQSNQAFNCMLELELPF